MSDPRADIGYCSDDLINLMGLGQSMIAALDKGKCDIATGQRFGGSHRVLPRHIWIVYSVNKTHRTRKRYGLPEDEIFATVFYQSHCNGRRLWVVRRGLKVDSFGFQERSCR